MPNINLSTWIALSAWLFALQPCRGPPASAPSGRRPPPPWRRPSPGLPLVVPPRPSGWKTISRSGPLGAPILPGNLETGYISNYKIMLPVQSFWTEDINDKFFNKLVKICDTSAVEGWMDFCLSSECEWRVCGDPRHANSRSCCIPSNQTLSTLPYIVPPTRHCLPYYTVQ